MSGQSGQRARRRRLTPFSQPRCLRPIARPTLSANSQAHQVSRKHVDLAMHPFLRHSFRPRGAAIAWTEGRGFIPVWLRKPIIALDDEKPLDVLASGEYRRLSRVISELESPTFS
jgi:hypothetical protein